MTEYQRSIADRPASMAYDATPYDSPDPDLDGDQTHRIADWGPGWLDEDRRRGGGIDH